MNDGESTGKVLLIGAGPGDPGLLTINAAKAIGAADVIVYDYLVNPEVLAHSRRGAELIYAGKRAGEHSMTQDEINNLLVTRARLGQLVARLKGGDPFVFGRGGEEAEALVEAGIEWEVIPGVSSGVAAAAYAGIPLTHRGYSSSVAFITGHGAREGKGSIVDWHAAAHAADTLVIFMCAGTIASIARELVESGRRPSTPVAIIRWGTYQHQETHIGTLGDLIGIDEAGVPSVEPPAIAIVGDVVKLSEKLNWFGSGPVALSSLSPAVMPSAFETVSKGRVRSSVFRREFVIQRKCKIQTSA
ncbi:MAG TPA: uroporphyrinogen-III C-methyltransferase [Blastocatellia bacterium]|nr:uroporphyrinogen-III C-methyltransferase [Blastocatellia bacterium]